MGRYKAADFRIAKMVENIMHHLAICIAIAIILTVVIYILQRPLYIIALTLIYIAYKF